MTDDSFARREALDPARSFIVQAPAGSGKTTVLTERLLALLLTVDEPEEILALTFTRKAAAEMLERVLKLLRMESQPASAHERGGWQLAQQVLERSRERGWALERSAGRLRVQTIDALNLSLASQLPVAARVGGRLRASDDVRDLYRRAALRTIEHADRDVASRPALEILLLRNDNDWPRLIASIAELLALRGHWVAHLHGDSGVLRERVESSLRAIVLAALQQAVQRIPAGALRVAAQLLPQVSANLRRAGIAGLEHWNDAVVPAAELAQLPQWREMARYALKSDGAALRTIVTKANGVPVEEKALKSQMHAWLADLATAPSAAKLMATVAELPDPQLSDEDSAALDAIASLLVRATIELQLLFAEAGRVDHVYVAGAARQALSDAGDPTELSLRLGNRLRHILVDEFQDTSVRQVELLQLLMRDWDDGDGRSIFLVGDPMQSIYLFRETDVGLFLRAWQGRFGPVTLQRLELRRNFRSRAPLVDFANNVFGQIFPAQADARAGAVPHLSSVATRPAGDDPRQGVHLHRIPGGDRAAEAQRCCEIIAAHRAAAPEASIAVLVRSRAHAMPIAQALLQAGISVAGVDLQPLAEVGVIQDLVALTRAMQHYGDQIAWLAVLRAPWCGLCLADLEHLTAGDGPVTLPERLLDRSFSARLSEDGQARVARLGAVLLGSSRLDPHWQGSAGIELAWRLLGGASACASADELVHARRFFDVLDARVAEQGWPEPEELQNLLDGLYAAPAAGIVQLMTVHKSKGLEFDLVLLPGLGRGAGRDRGELLRWIEMPAGDDAADGELAHSDLLLAPLTAAEAESHHPLWRLIGKLRTERQTHEQVRLLYVAATRARESLHLIGHLRSDDKGSVTAGSALATLWPALETAFLAAEPAPAAARAALHDAATGLRRLPADWSTGAASAAVDVASVPVARVELDDRPEFVWVAPLGRHVGTVVHSELQRASRLGLAHYETEFADTHSHQQHLQRLLAGLGLEPALLPRAVERVHTTLQRCLGDPRGRWIVGAHPQAHSEYALSGLHEGRLTQAVVDRWFIDAEGDCWVIDYKTSAHEGSDLDEFIANEVRRYAAQLQRYRELTRGLGYSRVRAALYFPLLGRFEELHDER